MEAVQLDVDNIEELFPDGEYDEVIEEMMEYIYSLMKKGVINE